VTRVLIAVESDEGDAGAALELGAMLARERQTRVALLTLAHDPPIGACWSLIPGSLTELRAESIERAHMWCTEVVRRLPREIPVESTVRRGRPHRVVDSMLASGGFGAVVLHGSRMGGRRMRRAARRWRALGIDVYLA
jgi:hypothetical protein